ncbi:MAG: triose-phosphate isomerase [bacterium]|jgi:triosephosphate isomerase
MRKPLIAGNWKMHKTVPESAVFAAALREKAAGLDGVEIVVCPPFTALYSLTALLADTPVALGAQDVHWENEGAHTGEISPPMLRDAGCRYVIIGHSERRAAGETDEAVNRKAAAAIAGGLIPILCVGETATERRDNRTEAVVGRQVREGLRGIKISDAELVVAYEPVWAIGTGVAATAADAAAVSRFIRETLRTLSGDSTAAQVRILYGGSVKPNNIGDFIQESDIDGALVGGASLDPETFLAIARRAGGREN